MKLPRTWPNNSDSSSVSGTPAQLIVTSGESAARAALMNQPRDDFLANAAFTGDQDFRVRSRGAFDFFLDARMAALVPMSRTVSSIWGFRGDALAVERGTL